MIEYTKEQKEAIRYFDSDLLISASSGSGKTRVLLEKVIELIKNGEDLNSILMVTFTNLASSEMKSKLENMLNERMDETNCDKFIEALKKINSADISTLDSFCQKLVREYYYTLNIEPDFQIKDEFFMSYLKNLALNQTIEKYIEQDDKVFIRISNLFVKKRNYDLFKEEILSFYNFLISKTDKFSFAKKMVESNYNTNINGNELISKFRENVKKHLESFKNRLLILRERADKLENDKLIEIITSYHEIVDANFTMNESFIKTFCEKPTFRQVRISNKATIDEVILKEELQNLAKKIRDYFSELNKLFDGKNLNTITSELNNGKILLNKFIEIVENFELNYAKLKNQNNCLDFTDLEVFTLKLFENETILNEVAKKYKYIFVDEYQDTNAVQEEILQKISINSKRIMVGDLKQSIYAFRECNPKIFNDKMIDFRENNSGKVIKLNMNFRSVNEILSFSNNIFSNLMRKENANYSYVDDGMFECGKQEKSTCKSLKPVEIVCQAAKSENIIDAKQNENYLVLNAIDKLLDEEIEENGKRRKLTYKDIAIISRKRSEKINSLCAFLEQNHIPISCKYFEKIYQSFEVELILAYLKILNNFDNEISLSSVLINLYNFSNDEIYKIKKSFLPEDILLYNEDDKIKLKIDKFLGDYNEFKKLINEISVKELTSKIIEKVKIDIILATLNGKIALERISVFENSIGDTFNLNEFISMIDNFKDRKFEIKKVDGENSVIIDTFHSTKGLEYTAVIIFDAGENIFSKNTFNLIYNAKFGIGIYDFNEENKTKTPNLIYSIVRILNREEEFNEEVRLSYVAFTRPKNYLIIIGTQKFEDLNEENNSVNFLEFKSYLNLVFSCPFEDYVNVTMINSDDDVLKIEKNQDEICVENLDYNKFNALFNAQYKFENAKNLQLKNSVTALSEEDKTIYNISNFKLTDFDETDYLAIGNAYHYCLEKLPMNLQTKAEVHNKIVNLIENKKLPENVYSYVNDDKLLKAIKQIAPLISDNDKVFKEQVFMMYVPYNIINKSEIEDKVLVQGVIDLFVEKDDEIILIDYKTSRLNDISVVKKYALQLDLYEKALKQKFKNKHIKKYIYSIFLDKLINIV